MKRNFFSLLCLLPVLFLTACAAENLPFRQNPPPSLIVSITDPVNNDRYPIDGAIRVSSNAVSDEAISKLELWIDGELVETYQPSNQELHYVAFTWKWSPTTQGTHTLLVRAYQTSGAVAQSNILNLTTTADPGMILVHATLAGETLDQIAIDYGVSVEAILLANPELDAGQWLPPGLEVRVPLGISEDSIGFLQVPVEQKTGWHPINFWLYSKPSIQTNRFTTATTSITALVVGCEAILEISEQGSNVSDYAIFRLNEGAVAFEKIASIPASGSGKTNFEDKNLPGGKYQYYVVASSPSLLAQAAGTPSNIVPVEISDGACAKTTATISSLFPPPVVSTQIYLYLSINKMDWIRYPQGEFVFADPKDLIDLVQLASLANPAGQPSSILFGEGWAWVGGELVFLGTFEKALTAAPAPAAVGDAPSLVNPYLSTELQARGVGLSSSKGYNWVETMGFTTYDTKTLRWGTNTGADQGIWQVATVPFDTSPSLNPACLVLTGVVDAGILETKKEFQINFSSLKPQPLTLETPKSEALKPGNVYIPGQSSASQPYSPQTVFKNSNQPEGVNVMPVTNFDLCKSSTATDGSKTYYIRILPTKNSQVLPKPSNTVVVTFSKAPPPISINYAPTNTFYDVKILEFTEMHVPDYTYAYCIKVIENPYYKMTIDKWGKAAPGSTVCPDNYEGEEDSNFLEDVGNFIESAVNYVSDLYNKLSDFVTELVDQLNPLCIQAKFISNAVGEGEKEVKDVCHKMAVVAVAAAKTYVGLPPSLPNFDQLKSMGKDYMVELAAEELENSGIPCPQECKDLIEEGIDYSLDQLKSGSSAPSCMSESNAHELGFEPLCPPKGVVTEPDYRGVPSPPLAVIEVTRRAGSDADNITQPASCYASLNGSATNDQYVGKQMTLWFGQVYFNWTGTSLNAPLVAASAPIPALKSGESVKIPLVLKPLPFWLPGHYQWYGKWQNVPTFDDWHMLYQGANLTLTADGDCEFPGYYDAVTTSVEGETKYYGPLGKAYGQTCYPFCP